MTEEQFIEEAKFAKVVRAPSGAGILIAGLVIEINGPALYAGFDEQFSYANALASALRRTIPVEECASTNGA